MEPITPNGEHVLTAGGTVEFCSAEGVGVKRVRVLANGTGTIRFVSETTFPDTDLGTSVSACALRSGVVYEYNLEGLRVLSAIIAFATATEVIVTWSIG